LIDKKNGGNPIQGYLYALKKRAGKREP